MIHLLLWKGAWYLGCALIFTQVWAEYASSHLNQEVGQRYVILSNYESSVLFSIDEHLDEIQTSSVIHRDGFSTLEKPCNNLVTLMLAFLTIPEHLCQVSWPAPSPRTTRSAFGRGDLGSGDRGDERRRGASSDEAGPSRDTGGEGNPRGSGPALSHDRSVSLVRFNESLC